MHQKIVDEFTEIENGKRSDGPKLDEALAAARLHRCPLIVSRVDRLTRSVSFLSKLLDANVDVRFADLPQIEGATGRFLLQQMAAVAELGAGLISTRTKAALAAAKRRGVKLGGFRGTMPTSRSSARARAALQARADERADDVLPIVRELQKGGAASLRAIAAGLNERGIPTARGTGRRPCRCPACSIGSKPTRAREHARKHATDLKGNKRAGCEFSTEPNF
jgi:DNA invertase Pin-like site-specific DNA recombinase